MMVEYALNKQFTDSTTIRGSYALKDTDFTARQDLVGLPEGKDVYVKVWFENLTNNRGKSEPVTGHFQTIGKHDKQHPFHLGRRYRWPGLGHQQKLRRYENL
jgi:alkaline phosphatase D